MADKKLVKKLDTVFSKYIRNRDDRGGVFLCCSCGELKPMGQADAGHFINRRWMATRWDDRNVHAQCRSCNRFNEGNASGYALFMLDKYGKDTVEYLNSLSKTTAKFTDSEVQLMIEDYKKR